MSQNKKMVQKILLSLFACTFLFVGKAYSQRARFEGTGIDDFFSLQTQPQPATLPPPPQQLNFPGLAATSPTAFPQGGVSLGQPTFQPPTFSQPTAIQTAPQFGTPSLPGFDPFSSGNQPFPVFPTVQQPAFIGNGNPNFQLPQNLQPPNIQPQVFQPQVAPVSPPPVQSFRDVTGNQPAFNYNLPQGQGYLPQNQWPYQGTGTDWLPSIDWTWANQAWSNFRNNFLPRVLERPRARQTWIYGSGGNSSIGNELGINDLEVATTATWPRFFGGPQPLRISPGFAAHWWHGPDTVETGVDLPPRAYSAYLAFDHTTDPARGFGFDNNFTIGVYSDFDNLSSDSLRMTGRLVGWRRINEYMVGKIGVEYLDRIRLKMLPVFGIYANPNPDMKIDLTFPRSKVSHRIPNFNNFEGWAYVGAEYGGGSWAIDRAAGFEDQVDINDVRAFMGLEWMGPRRVTGFFDVGYVFERELVYRTAPLADIPIQDSFMIRSGIAF
ncbi:hypothetical protein [Mariniblastus fucicola]|uniref:Uncharacterized protein n=1 Tax=Mariniblastus fucicola TaxID=980251 RepID=A0A5B9P2V0_9BACT|nr:hypothetical protein [Mariniblastus fucicola]QEG20688.1 hypothetical protein MFFC18_05380 [Mariniblastus fucicola]